MCSSLSSWQLGTAAAGFDDRAEDECSSRGREGAARTAGGREGWGGGGNGAMPMEACVVAPMQ